MVDGATRMQEMIRIVQRNRDGCPPPTLAAGIAWVQISHVHYGIGIAGGAGERAGRKVEEEASALALVSTVPGWVNLDRVGARHGWHRVQRFLTADAAAFGVGQASAFGQQQPVGVYQSPLEVRIPL